MCKCYDKLNHRVPPAQLYVAALGALCVPVAILAPVVLQWLSKHWWMARK